MENDLISVIVPVYNVEEYLKKCLDSIISQSYNNLEIILIDDGSSDKSGKICDEYEKKDKRIKVIHKKNGGLSSARNAGLDAAKGEFISFIDSDDWIYPGLFEKVMNEICRYDAQLAVFGIYVENGGSFFAVKTNMKSRCLNNYELMKSYSSGADIKTMACNKIYERKLFDDLRFPEGRIYEDEYIMHELLGKCERAAFIEDCFYVWLTRAGSTTKSKFSKKRYDIFEVKDRKTEYYRKNYPGLLKYIIFEKAYVAMYHMRDIILQFSYFSNRDIYYEVREIMRNAYKSAMKEADESFAAPLTKLAFYHPKRFFFKCVYDGIIMRLKKIIKKVIKRK